MFLEGEGGTFLEEGDKKEGTVVSFISLRIFVIIAAFQHLTPFLKGLLQFSLYGIKIIQMTSISANSCSEKVSYPMD